jgi:hypothetical protein
MTYVATAASTGTPGNLATIRISPPWQSATLQRLRRTPAARERRARVGAIVRDALAESVAISLRHARVALADDKRTAFEALSVDLDGWRPSRTTCRAYVRTRGRESVVT